MNGVRWYREGLTYRFERRNFVLEFRGFPNCPDVGKAGDCHVLQHHSLFRNLSPFIHLPQVDNLRNSWVIFTLSSVPTLLSLDHTQHEKEICVPLCLWIITGMWLAGQIFVSLLSLPLPSHLRRLPHANIFKNCKELLTGVRLVGKSWQERRGSLFPLPTSHSLLGLITVWNSENYGNNKLLWIIASFKLNATQASNK